MDDITRRRIEKIRESSSLVNMNTVARSYIFELINIIEAQDRKLVRLMEQLQLEKHIHASDPEDTFRS